MIRKTAGKMLDAFSRQNKQAKVQIEDVIGQAPGTAVFRGRQKMDEVTVQIIQYSESTCNEVKGSNVMELVRAIKPGLKTWINIFGLHDIELMEQLKAHFQLDPLLVEDVLDTHQRPKYEQFEPFIMLAGRMLDLAASRQYSSEQISILFNTSTLITFQENDEDVFDALRDRIRRASGRIRKRNIDYLAYAVLDSLIDYYILVIENFGEIIDELDSQVLAGSSDKKVIEHITLYKREINYLRKVIRPFREAIVQFEKSDVIRKENRPFIKDSIDHINQALESIELYRELLSDQMNIYNSNSTNKLNDIMRILTIISVIFIPMTFIAGVYGMNFEYFPELDNPHAYYFFWIGEITLAVIMLYLFKRKRWI